MKKIAIVSMIYFWTDLEPGPSRLFQIARVFCNSGYSVEVITSDFQHFKKEKRKVEDILSAGYPFKITFIPTLAYRKNIDIRRVISSNILAKRVRKYLSQNIKEYDAVYCTIPPNDVSASVAKVCSKYRVPLIVDVEDLWPEAMALIVKNEFIRKLLFHSFYLNAEVTYKNASGVIGTSEDYTERAFKECKQSIPKDTVYVGCNLEEFDSGVLKYSDEIIKGEEEFWVTYAGSISTSYDIETLIRAAQKLYLSGHKSIKIQILGTGSKKDEYESLVKREGIENVIFRGYIPYQKMAAFLWKSDIVINSFVKGAIQSIVNKVGDYLASGKAMINALENPVFCRMVDTYKVGINIEPENINALAKIILELKKNKDFRLSMGVNARRLAEVEFDRKVSYLRIVNMVDNIIENA